MMSLKRTTRIFNLNLGFIKTENKKWSSVTRCGARKSAEEEIRCEVDRRNFNTTLLSALLSIPLVYSTKVLATETGESTVKERYIDIKDSFSITYPSGWLNGEGAATSDIPNSTRRVIAWYPPDRNPEDVNLTLLITNIGADFVKMGSFGDVLTFGTNLVASMDRGFLQKKGQQEVPRAFLLEAKNIGGNYYIEYNLKRPGEDKKRFISLVSLGFNGIYNRLYTLTAQCPEEQYEKYRNTFAAALSSFKAPKEY